MEPGTETVLEMEGLSISFHTRQGTVRAVHELSYSLRKGETLGVVGESGCGKSVAALAILRLIPEPPGEILAGSIRFDGTDLLSVGESELERIRGNDISMIFQEPMTSLNPVLTIGEQIVETIVLHEGLPRRAAREKAVEMLRLVHIPEPMRRVHDYPHHMSGGMRQRVMIAMALACNPRILLADEPTTALDVTIQAQILDLMRELKERLGSAIVLITHDMGVIAENAQRVIVMYAGRKVEEAPVQELFANPCHPYTRGLLTSIPRPDRAAASDEEVRLQEIPGMVPSLLRVPRGCLFAPRCAYATEQCRNVYPPLETKRPQHLAACWHSDRVLEDAA
jgi:oligopeptide/dipeptide ABC transporter ATP-binding protein